MFRALRPAGGVRTLILLALLVGGVLVPQPALAQTTPEAPTAPRAPVICFVGQDDRVAGACTTTRTPNYLQGSDIEIELESFAGGETFLVARCVKGCPASDPSARAVYYAAYRGSAVRFPRDFVHVGPNDGVAPAGGNAVADRAPRFNSTWEVKLNAAEDVAAAPISRQFFVWLFDAFVGTNDTIRPGESHLLRASGFDPGADVTYRIERRDAATGRYETVHTASGRASLSGVAAGTFEDTKFGFVPSEAENIAACGRALSDCYRVVISGLGKSTETVNVLVGPAEIRRSDVTPADPAAEPTFERTQAATFDLDLVYPGGRLHSGPKLQSEWVPDSLTHGGKALRVAVEKVYRSNDTVFQLDEVPMRYVPQDFVWRAQWIIPKNLTPEQSTVRYRLRLVEQTDLWGNRIPADILGNFTVGRASIRPTVPDLFETVERTEIATLRMRVVYHDGTPFTPDDAQNGNLSPIRGCFVRIPPPPPPPAPPAQAQVDACGPNDPLTWGRYDSGGMWNFTVRYPREYENLDEHKFILVNDTIDRHNNVILGAVTPPFRVVPASPRMEFSTVMRGKEAEVLERGNRVFVTATVTYADGSPFNHDVRENASSPEASVLNGTLLRRGPAAPGARYGALAGEEPFNLTETDSNLGRWSGYLQLTDDDTFTPAGVWTFRFDLRDNLTVPNANLTAFDREIVSTTVVLCPTFQPPARVATGESLRFRFKLSYSECDTGREVPVNAISGKLSARIHRYSSQNLTAWGGALSNVLVPDFREGEWLVEYTVPHALYTGSYSIVVSGADTFGNRLLPASRSRPFATFTDVIERAVVADPAPDVRRGESATVIFDRREGDTGIDPNRAHPRIQLERFDTSTRECPDGEMLRGCWVREVADVRVNDPTLDDHVGVFPVDIDTPVGLYRFTLQGRDASYQLLRGVSGNFSVSPTQVARALQTLPPERIVKGEPFTFYLEHSPGDQLRDRVVFFNGRRVVLPVPNLVSEYGRVNVTWAIPFDAPTGNYTLRISGRDVNGNDILVLTPPIEALAASLEGRLLGQPTRVVERGTDARLLFGIGYPDGGLYLAQDTPRVFVHNVSGPVAQATVRREGLTFAADWKPRKDLPTGDYYFEVSAQPTGGTGNAFPPLRSNPFRVTPGRIVRPTIDDLPAEGIERLSAAAFTTAFEADDKFVSFELVYYGPSLAPQIDTTNPLPEVTRSPIPHTIDVDAGKYVARFVTDHASQTGTFRVVMTGEDGHGNTIVARSRQFLIRPTTIGIQFDKFPSQDKFGEGKTISMSFIAKYRVGTIMDESFGRPSVVALYNDRPITQRPTLEHVDGRWYLSWTAPDILPPGEYQFRLGGSDLQGNPIASASSNPFVVTEGSLANSAQKVIPGPEPILLLAALAGVALLAARRRR